jgi:hypothetical protein
MEVIADGGRKRKSLRAIHLFMTSLFITQEALLWLARERWSIEGWHRIRETKLLEDTHHYSGNGAAAMATYRVAVLNLLRLAGFWYVLA